MVRMKDKEVIADLRANNIELESEIIKLQCIIKDLEFNLSRVPVSKVVAPMLKPAKEPEHPNTK